MACFLFMLEQKVRSVPKRKRSFERNGPSPSDPSIYGGRGPLTNHLGFIARRAALWTGIEPVTGALTVQRSTAELPKNG